MAYTIKYSNGKILATIADQSYDSLTTSLTLVGKNSSAYGEAINQNFVKLLENFAGVNEPKSPISGQLWYNSAAGRMYVYTTSSFRPVGGTVISAIQPVGLAPGDLWIDTTKKQLWWFDGTNLTSSGKNYSDVTGKAGWVTETVLDTGLVEHLVSGLYNNGTIVAALSDTPIELNNTYCGTDFLDAGLTLNPTIGGVMFNGTATYALGIDGFMPENFLQNNIDGYTTGTLHLLNQTAATFGPDQNLQVFINNQVPSIVGAIPDAKLNIEVNNSNSGRVSLITLDGFSKNVGIGTPNPVYKLDVLGDVRVSGDLVVSGAQTIIETSILQVKDKNIELGTGQATPLDSLADGGGITLKGTTDHTIKYNNSRKSWDSSENFSVLSTKGFYVGSTLVLDANSIYSASAPGLIDLGRRPVAGGGFGPPMNSIAFDGMTLNKNKITTDPTTDLVISPGSGFVDFTGTQIINLVTPVTTSSAATKGYVDGEFLLRGYTTRKPYVFTIDTTYSVDPDTEILDYINKLLPIDGGILGSEYGQPEGSACSVLSVTYTATTSTSILNLNKSNASVVSAAGGNVIVLQDVAGSTTVLPKPMIPTYQVRVYQVLSSINTSSWAFLGIIT